ncbi:oligosaccharyl transferase, archaeosortase A system-associated [Halobacterium jilantaiense]|uniref:dolichyl-phosphooligosaccharide-protein glycotransferase n=1 Tax=Halobacterium jilantaiense TaxID=355548 RepID=A0A1I0MS84_9EURY|nr:oligosaccharyl transferase, archaeosortase A system-associated [Halobacterium jilantaiense]SEV91538.1 dolichyl-diphosphooligosaccharide--protein glycosyltransferase [Halobacterium jilantaiense]
MSEKTEASGLSSVSVDAALDALEDWYHVPALGAVLAFMFWVRVQAWENFTRDGQVYLSGNDAYYHLRQVTYTVRNFPDTMPFDVWTNFPNGTLAGQFGTLFDQLLATVALIVGLGSPSEQTIGMVLVIAPPVFGALLAIPVYFMGKRLGGRLGGVFSAVILGLLPGYFLQRTLAGAADHNGAEPLFMALAVLAMMVALTVAEREKPVFEQFLDRDVAGLRRVVGWSVLAGVATAVYMWVWPPGVLLVGIFGAFFLVKLVGDYVTGTSPDHVAVVGAVSMATTGLMMFVKIAESGFGVSGFSFLQPLFSFAVAFGCVFLAWLAREFDDRELSTSGYVGAVVGILVVAVGIIAVVLPDFWSMLQDQLLNYLGLSANASRRTIGEAQPFLAREAQYGLGMFGVIFLEYGLAFFSALVGAVAILLKPHVTSGSPRRIAGAAAAVGFVALLFVSPPLASSIGGIFGLGGQLTALLLVAGTLAAVAMTGDYEAEQLLVVVWGAFITSAAFTQVRFNYYLIVPVVVLNAYVLKGVLGLVNLDKPASTIEDVRWHQVATVTMVALLILVPVAAPAVAEATNNDSQRGSATPITLTNSQDQQVPLQSAITVGQNNGPGGVTEWADVMEWYDEHTPTQGTYDGADNADEMRYYGTYAQTDDFDYPEGAFGVMSWWDYGHWMTVEGNAVPHANPFQQGATTAANFLLADNESRAQAVLEGIEEDDAKNRYVAVDWKMIMPPRPGLQAGQSKFGAPLVFYDGPRDLSTGEFYQQAYNAQWEDGQITNAQYLQQSPLLKKQAYFESMMVRLYRYHGSAKQAQPVVLDWRETLTRLRGQPAAFDAATNNTRQFDSMAEAEAYVQNDSTSQIGGFQDLPQEDIAALEHYRLVGVSDDHTAPANLWYFGGELNPAYYPTSVKMFERVEGAEVTGTGPANTTVRASVEMNISQMVNDQGQSPTFTYTQYAETGADGEFTMTLPYSTTGYENYGPENGHTNVSVRAAGSYEFTTGNQTADDGLTVVEYANSADVSEAQVLGEGDEPVAVNLERQIVDEPEGANTSASESLTAPSELADAADGSEDSQSGGVDLTTGAVPALAGAVALGRLR